MMDIFDVAMSRKQGGGGGTGVPQEEYDALRNNLTKIVEGTLNTIEDDNVSKIISCAFEYHAIKSASFPNAKIAGSSAFRYCKDLEEVNLPSVNIVGSYAFENCKKLQSVSFPNGGAGFGETCSDNGTFKGCDVLEFVDLGGSATIKEDCFVGCVSLNTIVLRKVTPLISTMKARTALSSIDDFAGTPFAEGGTGGTIYCPEDDISYYKTATNWSALYEAGTCNFVAIEGSEYE